MTTEFRLDNGSHLSRLQLTSYGQTSREQQGEDRYATLYVKELVR